jgi:3-isopropylmalate/(R)-2-methylmalate dehydratase small subunit
MRWRPDMMEILKGRVWRFGDHVDTDQIIPAERLVSENENRLGEFAFEKTRPGLALSFQKGDIIVAGRNFGCGSSREHAPRALLQAGIVCVIAESFARIFYRNSINVGLLPVECRIEAEEGELLQVDAVNGRIVNLDSGKEWTFPQFPDFIRELMEGGGLLARIREGGNCTKSR